jgi:hypothetical protein
VSLVRGAESILCPRSYGPNRSPLHELHTRLQNAAYDAAAKAEDGQELTESAERQYGAIAYGEHNAYGMRAYVATTDGIADGHGPVAVRAAWLECQVCGLILPGEYRTAREQIGGAW